MLCGTASTKWGRGGRSFRSANQSPAVQGVCRCGSVDRSGDKPPGKLLLHTKKPPGLGESLQLPRAAIGKGDATPGDEVAHGAGHPDFTSIGKGRHSGSDMDGDTCDV